MITKRISRRRFTAGGVATIGSLVLPAGHVRAQDDQKVLRILGWPDYFDDTITAPFREANNCRIEITGIATPDDTMLFLRAGGTRFYDIVSPAVGLVNPLGVAGLLAEIDPAKLSHFYGLFPQFQALPTAGIDGKHFGAPLIWGTFALAYSSAVDDPPANWLDLHDKTYADRLVMPDDGLSHLCLWNWALGATDPMRVSKAVLDETTRALITLRQNQVIAFGGTAYGGMMSVADGIGDFSTIGWQSAPLLTSDGQRALTTTRPAPGGLSFCDCIAMVAGSHDPELALLFIDFMLSSETQRNLIERTQWATVAQGTPPMLRPELSTLYDYAKLDEWLAGSPVRGYPPLGDDGSGAATYLDWTLAWDRVRQSRS